MGERRPLLPFDGGIALRVEGAKASMVRGKGKGLSWTRAHPGERMGRTRHPGAVRAGQTELKAQSPGLTAGAAGRGCRHWASTGGPVMGSERHRGEVCVVAARAGGRPGGH